MSVRGLQRWVVVGVLGVSSALCHAAKNKEPLGYARSLLAGGLEIIYKGDKASPRITYATEQVRIACEEVSTGGTLQVSVQGSDGADKLKPEGFRLTSLGDNSFSIVGADRSGVLYGCLELADRIRIAKAMPAKPDVTDAPEFKLRGPAIGMQKLGGKYLWPYTPKNFPFFYDKEHWREYLDFLVSVRMNSLYLWNGHPFASLVQLDDYPEALEVTPEILKKNREMMYWLTSECDKRGIWLIQMFYNIHLPKGLGLGTSLRRSNPKAADYTRKSIAKFVEEYPNVGLLVCLGEALSGKENQVEWFTRTIIPGMKDGLKARGQTELPPIVVRGHHIIEHGSHKDVLSEGLKLYPNLFSMVKYNGESLTSETPRGKYQQYHKDMARYSGTHMANVHCLSNLEPFRYADFSFIWNSCKAIRDRLDGNGLHLYPLGYWNWPNTPDTAEITQLKRDRLWFEIWARYCWKLDRDPAAEQEHWIGRLTETYGTRKAAEKIYAAYNAYGECAPRILRRFGITGGNRQCMSLGMFLEQLTDPKKSRVWQELYDSDSPPGETITQYITNEYANKPHVGETPPQIIKEVLAFADEAVKQINAAAQFVTKDKQEFDRLRNDIHCIDALSKNYCAKVQAAMMVHRYRRSKDTTYMKKALPLLEDSLVHYKTLVELTRDTYRYSNGFHGRQRVPKSGIYHWSQLVGSYEKELADFKKKIASLDGKTSTKTGINKTDAKPWPAARFKLLTKGIETYKVKKDAKVFTDRNYTINDIAPQLLGLTGMRFSRQKAKKGGIIKIDFEAAEPVKVLVGYFDSKAKSWLQVPMLEHVAHANDRGGLDTVLENVAEIGDTTAYRDPSLHYHEGVFYLFFNLVRSDGGVQRSGKSLPNRTLQVALVTSRDLVNWSQPRLLTPADKTKNFHPVGNVVRFRGEWLLGVCSYPTPNDEKYGTGDARGYLMRSKDLVNWSKPDLIPLLGPEVPFGKMGRILGTWFLEDRNEPSKWWAFYKHDGGHISASWTRDFQTWEPLGKTGIYGENECVLLVDGWYWLISSPGDGIDFSRSKDLKTWRKMRKEKLGQKDWPWAQGRLTAAHVIDLRHVPGVCKFIMVFHGSDYPEGDPRGGFDNFASIGLAWSKDLTTWQWPGKGIITAGGTQTKPFAGKCDMKKLVVLSEHQGPVIGPDNPFGEISKANNNSTLNIHLLPKGEFEVGKDQWGDIVRVNMLKIKDFSKVSGAKLTSTATVTRTSSCLLAPGTGDQIRSFS